MRRLSTAGFKKDFVRPAIMPDWWDDDCAKDPDLLPDIEIRVARFLGCSVAEIRDISFKLAAPKYELAQLRRVRDISRDVLAPAIHSALQVAAAVARCMRDPSKPVVLPPTDGVTWRDQIQRATLAVTLDDIIADLWKRGIPVVPMEILPKPNFQGLACVVEGRPVILLAHKHDEPGRVSFIVAHEAGHVANGDCAPDQPVVDEEPEVRDDAVVEQRADRFATRTLVGQDQVPLIGASDFRSLAKLAVSLEQETGADASTLIFAWARQTRDYTKATLAVKALYRSTGARQKLCQHFYNNVDLNTASDSDALLLRCVYGAP